MVCFSIAIFHHKSSNRLFVYYFIPDEIERRPARYLKPVSSIRDIYK